MTTPDITLCMIVKDEAEHLERCLSSVRGLVSEIIIADTGSEDNSKAIAGKFGAKVIDIPWEHDFAKARNMSLTQASCAWILVLDADEAAGDWMEDTLHELLCAEPIHGYWLPIIHYVGSKSTADYVTDHVCRLFRNDERIRFRGTIHEDVVSSIETLQDSSISYADLPITHYGYLEDELQHKNKYMRNLHLINQGLQLQPESLPLRYALGAEYYQQGQYDTAANILLPLLSEVSPSSGYASDIFLKTAFALQQCRRMEEADAVYRDGTLLFPDFTDLLESYAHLLIEQGDLKKAYHYLRQALLNTNAAQQYPSSSGSGTYRTEQLAGKVSERLFLYQEARRHYETALQSAPNFRDTWRELVPLYLLSGEANKLIELTSRNISCLSPDTLSILLPAALNARLPEWLAELCKAPQLPASVQAVVLVLLEMFHEQKNFISTTPLENLLHHHSDRPFILGYLWALSCRNEDVKSINKWFASLAPYKPGLLAIQQLLKGYSGVTTTPSDLAYATQLLLQTGAWRHLLTLYQRSNASFLKWCKLPQSLLYGLLQTPLSVKNQWCTIYNDQEHDYSHSTDSADWLLYAAMACSCGTIPRLHSTDERTLKRSSDPAIAVGLAYHKLLLAADNDPLGIPTGSIPWALLVRSTSLTRTSN